MQKAPLDIIADNLPTYSDIYPMAPRRLPTADRLAKDAARIMAALAAEGFEIVRMSDPGQPPLNP